MVVILFLLLLAAVAGVLGAVLKAVVFLVLTVVLTLTVLGLAAIYALRRKLKQVAQELGTAGRTQVHVGSPQPRGGDGGAGLPSPRDDRY